MRRLIAPLLLALGLGVCGALVHERTPEERLADAAARLQQMVDRAYANLAERARATLETGTLPMDQAHAAGEGGLRLYRQGAVTAWTDHAPITDTGLDSARGSHLDLADGIYLHAHAAQGDNRVHAVQRVWFRPPFENQYLERHFDAGFNLPQGIVAVAGPGNGPEVRNAEGQTMMHLQWADGEALPGKRSLISLLLTLVAIGAAAVALWRLCMLIPGPWASMAVFLTATLGARYATLGLGSRGMLSRHPLFDPSLFASSFLMPSLGDLLINALVLLFAALFVHRAMRRAQVRTMPWVAASLAAVVLFLLAGTVAVVTTALVHDSSVNLDLFRAQDIDGYSVIALTAIALLLLAWSVLADALIRLIGTRIDGKRLLLPALAACGLLIAINHAAGQYDLVPALWPLPALAAIRHMRRGPAALPALLLIAVLALFTAHVLNRQTFKRLEMDRQAIAESSTTPEDPVVELLFGEARHEMAADPTLLKWLRSGAPCSATDLDRMVRQPFFSGYWDRYDLRLHLVTAQGTYCTTSPDATATAIAIEDRFQQGVPTGGHNDLRITGRPGESALYLGHAELDSARIYVELRPRPVADGLGFPDLLLAGQRPALLKPDRFVQARYERGILTSSTGPFVLPVAWNRAVPPDGLQWSMAGYDLLARGDAQGSVLVLGTRIPTWWDHVTTFSYVFLFYCLLVGLMVAASLLWRSHRLAAMGVSGKVRLGVAGFALTGLLIFSFGMIRMVDVRQQQRSFRTLNERTRGVLAELRQVIPWEETLPPNMGPYMDRLLANLSNVFFTDLTLYAPDGTLYATSREQVFNAGLLGRRMDPRAYHKLAVDEASFHIGAEHIGKAGFSTAYMPFRNEQGKVLAYLALPYFARQGEVEQERASGYVALVNLFTLLFLLSVVAAALIAHWTTRPLELLRRGLERIGLGAVNEPINYRGNDELGQLVRVYNHKVEELRESALKLARSERESAWREMAKQVAHEIKNPLTPMKLNIQQFQRAWDPQAPDAKERLDRFSSGLVEQIDVLSRIAGEFSHFAQIPPARPEQVDLVEVARTAVQLFADTPTCTVGLHGEAPLPVLADREHLLRVFNNLIKNALQALPDGSEGCVDVLLRQEGDEAVAQVRDNGTGIAPEDRDRIFEPSFTTKGSGMGLGLAMVKRMVENAGGRVWFETQEGRGTSFFVALPLEKQPGI